MSSRNDNCPEIRGVPKINNVADYILMNSSNQSPNNDLPNETVTAPSIEDKNPDIIYYLHEKEKGTTTEEPKQSTTSTKTAKTTEITTTSVTNPSTKSTTTEPLTEGPTIKTRIPRIRKIKTLPHIITDDDIEYIREIVRIDKGLPTTKKEQKKSIDLSKSPVNLPKLNRVSRTRYQYVRASFPRLEHFRLCHKNYSKDEAMKPREEIWEERKIRRLRKLAKEYKECEDPFYKFNKVFALRYQHNKGNPAMPDSFRQSYERYQKPLFRLVKELDLPKKYLMPEFKRDEISLLGLVNEQIIPLTSQKIEEQETYEYLKRKRKHVMKRGRVVRLLNVNPTGPKVPWNYRKNWRTDSSSSL